MYVHPIPVRMEEHASIGEMDTDARVHPTIRATYVQHMV